MELQSLGSAGKAEPAMNPHVPQSRHLAARGPGQRALSQPVNHRHHGQRRHGPGRAVVVQPAITRRIERLIARITQAIRVRDQPHAQPRGRVNAQTIHPERHIGDRVCFAIELLARRNVKVDRHLGGRGEHLAPIFPGHGLVELDGFEAGTLDAGGHAGLQHVELQRLDHGLDTQGARLYRIPHEVTLEEPFVGVHVDLGPDATQTMGSAFRPEAGDAIKQEEHGTGQGRFVAAVAGRARGQFPPKVAWLAQARPVGFRSRQARLIRQGLLGKEAEGGRHLEDLLIAHEALHLEADNGHAAQTAQARIGDVGAQQTVFREDLPQLIGRPVQVAEVKLLVALEHRALVGRKPATRLERGLEQHSIGHGATAVFCKIPGVGRNLILRLQRTAGHGFGLLGIETSNARHEEIGRTRQTRAALRPVKAGKDLAECIRRLAPGAGGNRFRVVDVVRRPGIAGRFRIGQFDAFQQGRPALQGIGRHQAQAHAPAVEGAQAVHRAEQVGIEHGNGAVNDLFHEDLVDDLLCAGRDLASGAQDVGLLGDGLKAPAVAVQGVSHGGQIEGHGLQAPFQHEGAGHTGIVLEMAVKEPLVRRQVILSAQIAASPGSALGIEVHDFVKEEHRAGRDGRRAYMGLGGPEVIAEAVGDAPFRIGHDLLGRERGSTHRHGRRIQARVGLEFGGVGVPDDAGRGIQFGIGEETGLAVAYGKGQPIAHVAVVVEKEKPHVALLGIAVYVNLKVERIADPGQFAMESRLTTEQAIDAFALVLEIRT